MNEQLARITKEAEEKYPLLPLLTVSVKHDGEVFFAPCQDIDEGYDNNKARVEYNIKQEAKQDGYFDGATHYAERSEKLRECLQQCVEVMQVLEDAGFLKVIENDNILDKSKQALNEYE